MFNKSLGSTRSLTTERKNEMHQLALCPMSSKQSTLKAYKRLKYLNVKIEAPANTDEGIMALEDLATLADF